MLPTPPINEVLACYEVAIDSESLKALLGAISMFDHCQTRPTCLVVGGGLHRAEAVS